MDKEEINLLDFPENSLNPHQISIEKNEKYSHLQQDMLKNYEIPLVLQQEQSYVDTCTTTTGIPITTITSDMKIIVNLRIINMGSDIKFEEDPFNVTLHGIMDPFDYSNSIRKINMELEECRANIIDHALLAAGPTLIPLVPWAIRLKIRKNYRRKILTQCIETFNKDHPHLFMRWQTRPEKQLTIMSKAAAVKLMSK